ncbi:hypothetical protein [Oenococcus oeni]|uniref:Lipoprotein n=2 Tax=Oenococcus oeni TaxID=1247 RepID=Q04G39_OENOB|nr:hypothetical protein [Oenococcus oeni]KGH72270.1 hypothetical protein X280_05340 [Oenococcus oeni IOEB_0502]KGH95736.1 hypothetical protein X300_02480 [Oenococcus oeni IOEB_S436a]ABJ56583.1 hypothetical protein, lipoprotein [Oenococcus oeni PSU-1]AWW98257.1 hypothetical protein C5H79_01425 [Oenococcus oeni]EFD88952.1 hypothetical protein AWRIB429_0593 [Oenococcus oeni AWRIB429]
MKKFLLFLGIFLLLLIGVGFYAWHIERDSSDKYQQLKTLAKKQVEENKYKQAKKTLTNSLDFVINQGAIESKINQISSFQEASKFLKVKNYSDAITAFKKIQSYKNGYNILLSRANDSIEKARQAIEEQKNQAAKESSEETETAGQADSASASSSEAAKSSSSIASEWTKIYQTTSSIPQEVVDQGRKNLQDAGVNTDAISDLKIREMIVAAGKLQENIVTYAKENGYSN